MRDDTFEIIGKAIRESRAIDPPTPVRMEAETFLIRSMDALMRLSETLPEITADALRVAAQDLHSLSQAAFIGAGPMPEPDANAEEAPKPATRKRRVRK